MEDTYLADVDSLVDISKLTLTDAAPQLNTIPLNLVVPRYTHDNTRIGLYTKNNTETQEQSF